MILKSQYFWRSYLSYVLILFIATSFFAALLLNRSQQDEVIFVEQSLRAQSELLALNNSRPLRNLDYETIRQSVTLMSELTGARYTIIDVNGVVIADSEDITFSLENYLTRPEIQQAIQRGYGQVLRYSELDGEDVWFSASPIYAQNQLLGIARTARVVMDVVTGIEERQGVILKFASIILFVGLLVAFYLSARQALVIEKVTLVAEHVSNGDFEKRVAEKNTLGLKKLAKVINQLARKSADRVAVITSDRNRLGTIFAGLVEGVIDVDQKQNIIHINDAAAKLLNLSGIACSGKPVWDAIRQHEIIDAIDQVIKKQTVINSQIKLSRRTMGKSLELVVDVYAASLSDDAGLPIGAVVLLHDISKLKQLERVRADFVANASHELKTPITAIRGLSETVLADEQVDRQTLLSFMDRVHGQSLRLSDLVGDLLTISRLESDQNQEKLENLEMTELVSRCVQTATLSKEKKGQQLITEFAEQNIEVIGDRQSLSQLIDNLIDNAIKYTPNGGEIKVSLYTENGNMLLSVKDNGLGISPQYQRRIFERFYRVDKARSQSLGGTGLGLSIVKNIAEKHGGSVSLESFPGNGSTFTFKMPKD